MHFKCHTVTFKHGRSYIDSPVQLKNKKATINLKNGDNKSSQYAATVALNHQEIETHLERASNIAPFIKKYNWNGIKYPSKLEDRKRPEKNNSEIALKILYAKDTVILLDLSFTS